MHQILSNASKPLLVLDTSTLINLNATGIVSIILQALPYRVAMSQVAAAELKNKKATAQGYLDGEVLDGLVHLGFIELLPLDVQSGETFASLVTGSAAETLDDGEAATIATALTNKAIAVIDERKANKICNARFPELVVLATTDLLFDLNVRTDIGDQSLADGIYNALLNARMRVPDRHHVAVVELVGQERAATCTSLPLSVRIMKVKNPEKVE